MSEETMKKGKRNSEGRAADPLPVGFGWRHLGLRLRLRRRGYGADSIASGAAFGAPVR